MKQNKRKPNSLRQAVTMLTELCHEMSELCKFTQTAINSEDPELIRQGEQLAHQLEERNRQFEEQIKNL